MDQTVILSRKWELPGQALASWGLGILGLVLLVAQWHPYHGFASIVAGYLLAPIHLGVVFKRNDKQYRIYRSWAGLKLGEWQPLPEVVHVTLKYFSYYQTTTSGRAQTKETNQHKQYILLLSILNSNQGLILREYNSSQLEEARLTAASIAAALGVDTQEFLGQDT